MRNKKEIKIDDLKENFTEQEAEALALALLNNSNNIYISNGGEFLDTFRARNKGTAGACFDLFGLPYISQSVNGKAAALWNTNTAAHLIGLDVFEFLGVAIGNGGEFVGLFQEHNANGEEVGGVRCLILDTLQEFQREEIRRRKEAAKVEELTNHNKRNAEILAHLPKVCEIFNKYRGKRWGETTRDKIKKEIDALKIGEGLRAFFVVDGYYLNLKYIQHYNYAGGVSFWWQWDTDKNEPAGEIKPNARDLGKLQPVEIKQHRAKLQKIAEEMEKHAQKLAELIDQYNEETSGKPYKRRGNTKKYGVNLSDLNARDLME